MELQYTATPVQEIRSTVFDEAGVRVLIKREDQNHPLVSGNKWWKLKYNLVEAERLGKNTLLTFGGAYSNHLYSTAAAAHALGFKSIGIVRGEETLPLNPTLRFANQRGMILRYVSRERYRNKSSAEFVQQLKDEWGDFYLVPEGGTNEFAVRGCAEFGEALAQLKADYICLPVGTGGTMAGIVKGLKGESEILGFPVLKDGDFLRKEIQALEPDTFIYSNWKLVTDYHFGGYAKTTPTLLQFIHQFDHDHSIPLDQVYTGKMLWGIFDLVEKGFFKKGATILAIHTGGLQGRLI